MLDVKSAVLICPAFFDYKTLIEKQLQKRFSSVYAFSDRPACSSVSKALIKYNVGYYRGYASKKYTQHILLQIIPIIASVSVLIIIKGTCISDALISEVKKYNPNIRVLAYSWDSIVNAKGFVKLATLADKSMSFDFHDCLKYHFDYLPLFFADKLDFVHVTDTAIKRYKYSFIGSYHGDRVKLLSIFLNREGVSYSNAFIRVYFQSKIQYLIFYLIDPYIRQCPKEWITFDIVKRNHMNEVLSNSEFIVDIHHKGQSGLTMRTWETLSLNYRLLTTNPYILLHQPIETVDILDRDSAEFWNDDKKQLFIDQVTSDKNVPTTTLSLPLWVDELLK